MTIQSVTAGTVRPTRYDVSEGVDVAVTIELEDGRSIDGDVTVCPDEVNGGWSAYGNAPDLWASASLLAVWPDGRQEAQRFASEIVAAASVAAKRWAREQA